MWGEGYITLVPTDDEYIWLIYNFIQKEDHIRMKTKWKIVYLQYECYRVKEDMNETTNNNFINSWHQLICKGG